MSRMKVNLAGVELKNPVMTASGTFGSGAEYSEFVDLNKLGAVVTKGVANVPWPGNPTPRVTETASGMLNAIGLQNPGIDVFCERDIPFLKKYDTKIIVNVCGKSTKDYCEVVERLGNEPVDMLEINISCPNVKAGALAFGQDPKHVEELTGEIRRGEGMIGVLLDSDKGEYMVSVGDSEGAGGMESAVENPVVANENKMTSVGFLQGTAFMEDGPIPIAAYYADAEGDSFSTVPAERILETNGKCLKESGVDYCLIITCEFK